MINPNLSLRGNEINVKNERSVVAMFVGHIKCFKPSGLGKLAIKLSSALFTFYKRQHMRA